jgi:hypothetical protein
LCVLIRGAMIITPRACAHGPGPPQGGMMKRAILVGVLAIFVAGPAIAKDTQFWNLTASTVKSLELAPADGILSIAGAGPWNDEPYVVERSSEGVALRWSDGKGNWVEKRMTPARGRYGLATEIRSPLLPPKSPERNRRLGVDGIGSVIFVLLR